MKDKKDYTGDPVLQDLQATLEGIEDIDDALTREGEPGNTFYYYKGKLINGMVYSVYENGQLEEECNFKEGYLHGAHREWFKNGQLNKTETFITKNTNLENLLNISEDRLDNEENKITYLKGILHNLKAINDLNKDELTKKFPLHKSP